MLTLSLVFEDREGGELQDYERIDLDTVTALRWCASMVGDDDIDDDLRFALLKFISTLSRNAYCIRRSSGGPRRTSGSS